jgi:serine/threonine protein phosphatase PrpC
MSLECIMLPSEKESFPNTRLTSAIKQSIQAQDMILTGEYHDDLDAKNNFQWIVCADGHGSYLPSDIQCVISLFREFDWEDIILCNSAQEFSEKINNVLKKFKTTYSGATLSIVKIYADHFDCYWIGDSEIRIFKNNEEIFRIESHNHTNESEMQRIKDLSIPISDTKNMKLLDEGTITMIDEGHYFHFELNDKCNMTRTFGHNQQCKEFMEYTRVERYASSGPADKYKIVVGSDGLWDMVADFDHKYISDPINEAQQLVDFASDRWYQKWIFTREDVDGNTISSPAQFKPNTSQIDDVCVATWMEV